MRTLRILTLITIVVLGFASCDENNEPILIPVESNQVTNLHAPQTTDYTTNPPTNSGDFVKFDFSAGETTMSDTDWDIAFRGTTILVNGGSSAGISDEPQRTGNAGAYIENSIFSEFNQVDETYFNQDSSNGLAIATGSGNGWYNYANFTITPIAGKVLVIRTADNRFAKIEILSYYKDFDNTDSSNSRYYTFNYVYQPNENETSFE